MDTKTNHIETVKQLKGNFHNQSFKNRSKNVLLDESKNKDTLIYIQI